MKKPTILIFIVIMILSCSTGGGTRHMTFNPHVPYIYENGFENFELHSILTIKGEDSIYLNELRFNAVYSAMYTQKLMFDRFGKWDKAIHPNQGIHPVLIWENVKLFDNKDELYKIFANGRESRVELYASVMVFDSINRDRLAVSNSERDSIIKYFSNGIINLSSNRDFYDVYWKMVYENKGDYGTLENRGHLDSLLTINTNRKIDSTKPLVIVYYPGKDSCNISCATKRTRSKWIKEMENGVNKIRKSNIVYVYKDGDGLSEKYNKSIEWIKDPEQTIESLFFTQHDSFFTQHHPCSGFVVISEKGNFIRNFGEFHKESIKKAVKILVNEQNI